MALTSPRFKSSDTLKNVEANRTVLAQGANGRAVHLVQMALTDLKFPMPLSTGRADRSPDGIYGGETLAAIKKFQKSNNLKDDGVLGQKTIRVLDQRFSGFQHRVRLHFRSTELTQQPFDRLLANAQLVYGQYGIKIDMANGESLRLSAADQALFDQIDQECQWVLDDGEIKRLHGLGTPAPATDILVYFVRAFSDPRMLGCGGHGGGRPACTVAAAGSQWSMAHEVGHVLLGSSFAPVHMGSTRNLMFASTPGITGIPVLTDAQVARIRTSTSCQAI